MLAIEPRPTEKRLLGKVASAARRYVGETKAFQDTDSWRELKEALKALDEFRDQREAFQETA